MRSTSRLRVLALAIATLYLSGSVGTGTVVAQELARSGVQEHDGFMLRLLYGGFGVDWLADRDRDWSMLSVFGAEYSAGWVATPGWALHGSCWAVPGFFVGIVALGGGVTYYMEPSNSYLSVMAGWPEALIESESEAAIAVRADVGKEWWVSDNWGIGLALSVDYWRTSGGDFGEGEDAWSGLVTSVSFSATYN